MEPIDPVYLGRMGWRWWRWLVCLAVVFGCTASDDVEVNRRSCVRLRDHLVDLRLKSIDQGNVDQEAHRGAMKRALGEDFIRGCEQTLTVTQLSCALEATDAATASACNRTTAAN